MVTTSKTEPRTTLGLLKGSGDFQPRKIKAALMGRISRMCVYCSSWSASTNEAVSGDRQIASEIALRMEKACRDKDAEVDCVFGERGTM